jgi:hypothetical protein
MPFSVSKNSKSFQDLSEIMGDHLIRLSELLIQNNKIPNRDVLLNALSKTNLSQITSIPSNYLKHVKVPCIEKSLRLPRTAASRNQNH